MVHRLLPQRRQDALAAAVINGDALRVAQALEAGARPEQADVLGESALHWAAAMGHDHLLTVLWEAVHDRTQEWVNAQGDTLWHCAARQGHERVLQWLATHRIPGVAQRNQAGQTPLHLAIEAQQASAAIGLLTLGPSTLVHQQTVQGRSPLMEVAQWGDLRVAQAFVQAGAAWDHASRHQGLALPSAWSVWLTHHPHTAAQVRPTGAPVVAFPFSRAPGAP